MKVCEQEFPFIRQFDLPPPVAVTYSATGSLFVCTALRVCVCVLCLYVFMYYVCTFVCMYYGCVCVYVWMDVCVVYKVL
jgi:hypothetical protein